MLCKHCPHTSAAHFTFEPKPCLEPGCRCRGFESREAGPMPTMFSVRIDKVERDSEDDTLYHFQVSTMPWCPELIALDSTPGVIAFVEAPDPGAAAARAWEKGQRELASLRGLPPSSPEKLLELLGDKKPEGST